MSETQTPTFEIVEQKFYITCQKFLQDIDQVEAEIVAAVGDEERLKKLQDRKVRLHFGFAALLTLYTNKFYEPSDKGYSAEYAFCIGDRLVAPHWKVEGQPPRSKFDEARAWMASRGHEWSGSAKTLRLEVAKALTQSEKVPKGMFGFTPNFFVKISAPGWLKKYPSTGLRVYLTSDM